MRKRLLAPEITTVVPNHEPVMKTEPLTTCWWWRHRRLQSQGGAFIGERIGVREPPTQATALLGHNFALRPAGMIQPMAAMARKLADESELQQAICQSRLWNGKNVVFEMAQPPRVRSVASSTQYGLIGMPGVAGPDISGSASSPRLERRRSPAALASMES